MKRIAIIGGGIFGVSCALELSRLFNVTLFETNSSLLSGASLGNQNRFHFGYHYPRSPTTGIECLQAINDFDSAYGSALLSDFDNFYCVAKKESKTSASEYLEFCRKLSLPYSKALPPARFLRRDRISLCIRVPEPIFDVVRLRSIVNRRIANSDSIIVRLDSRVVGARITAMGKKSLKVKQHDGTSEQEFDYVVNASYSRLNELAEWLGAEQRNFIFETVEVPVIRLPSNRRIGLTIMDGDFCSILPFGGSRLTLLYHAAESVLDHRISKMYPVSPCLETKSMQIIRASTRYMPILENSELISSMVVVRVIDPSSESDDARHSVIWKLGAGCWSIFSGKVVTAVTIAKRISKLVQEEGGAPRH